MAVKRLINDNIRVGDDGKTYIKIAVRDGSPIEQLAIVFAGYCAVQPHATSNSISVNTTDGFVLMKEHFNKRRKAIAFVKWLDRLLGNVITELKTIPEMTALLKKYNKDIQDAYLQCSSSVSEKKTSTTKMITTGRKINENIHMINGRTYITYRGIEGAFYQKAARVYDGYCTVQTTKHRTGNVYRISVNTTESFFMILQFSFTLQQSATAFAKWLDRQLANIAGELKTPEQLRDIFGAHVESIKEAYFHYQETRTAYPDIQ
jgi:methyl-accepting chemotaxis protein